MWSLIHKSRFRAQRIALHRAGCDAGDEQCEIREHALFELAQHVNLLFDQKRFEMPFRGRRVKSSSARGLLIGATRVPPGRRSEQELLLLHYVLKAASCTFRTDAKDLPRKLRRQAARAHRELSRREPAAWSAYGRNCVEQLVLLNALWALVEEVEEPAASAARQGIQELSFKMFGAVSNVSHSENDRAFTADYLRKNFTQVFRSQFQHELLHYLVDVFNPALRSPGESTALIALLGCLREQLGRQERQASNVPTLSERYWMLMNRIAEHQGREVQKFLEIFSDSDEIFDL